MAISKIAGQMLKNTLERDGANLAISDTVADTPVIFVDITDSRVGINNATPTEALDISGNVIADNLFSTTSISAGGNIIGGNVNTTGAMSATGNSTANFFIGNGSQLTGIDATSIQNGNSNVKVYANANVATSVNGNANVFVVTGTGADVNGTISVSGNGTFGNIETVGYVSATGNITGGNVLTSGLISATSNIIGGNILTVGVVSSTGNATHGNVLTGGEVSATGNVTGGNVLTGGLISATGNVTGNNFIAENAFIGNIQVTGNIDVNSLTSNTFVSATGNVIGGNILTGGLISATGNVTGNYFIGNGSQLTGIDATSIQNGNSNVKVYANSDVATSVAGNANVFLVTADGANVTGTLDVSGNLVANGVILSANTISAESGILSFGSNANITISGGLANYVLATDGTGNLSWTSAGDIGVVGNAIPMGTNTLGNLVSNAVVLTTTTTVTDGITQLNTVLGKLVPPAPSNFPGGQTLSISGLATYRMANITQVDNTPGANKAVAAGNTITNVLRVATYATNTITTVGPGDSGTITAVRNGANVGTVTLNAGASPSANGTYGGNLVITNNFDYRNANANIAAGFWYVFSSAVSGTAAPAGWNEVYIVDSATANTNIPSWYYDNSSPATPSFSASTMAPPGSPTLLYSSTIPHYTNATQFAISANVANVSGNTYPTSNTLASGSAAGSFAAPASVTYSASNIGSNVLNSFASASFSTTANVTTGFGASSTGPSMSVNNSYSTGTLTLTTALGNIALYKSGTATAIDEGNVIVTGVGTGSGNAVRIINPGSGNTPAYTGSEANFNSQSSTLQTYDATVVGSGSQGVLKHDQTNYSTGYLPAGPNLSAGRTGTQYFTIKFVRTNVSKFDITYAGNVAGMWVALPGSVIDSSSSANGWISMTTAYAGAGYPGVNAPGNGSDGCALGGVVVPNVSTASTNKTCTFGTVSSSSTATNEIYVRIALTSGQSVTGLSLNAASN